MTALRGIEGILSRPFAREELVGGILGGVAMLAPRHAASAATRYVVRDALRAASSISDNPALDAYERVFVCFAGLALSEEAARAVWAEPRPTPAPIDALANVIAIVAQDVLETVRAKAWSTS